MRRAALPLGLLTLALVWLGPLPHLAPRSFAAHMTMHMGVVAIAAPLLALAAVGGARDPARRFPSVFRAIPASVVELVVVWAWHAPVLHHAARASELWLVAEQGMFLAAGLLVWISAFGADGGPAGQRAGAGVVALLLTSMHMTLLGSLLALSPRALYVHGPTATGATPLDDQHLGGAIMLLVGGVAYLAGGLWLSVKLLQSEPVRQQRGVG